MRSSRFRTSARKRAAERRAGSAGYTLMGGLVGFSVGQWLRPHQHPAPRPVLTVGCLAVALLPLRRRQHCIETIQLRLTRFAERCGRAALDQRDTMLLAAWRTNNRVAVFLVEHGTPSHELLKKIGELTVERDFLARGLPRSR